MVQDPEANAYIEQACLKISLNWNLAIIATNVVGSLILGQAVTVKGGVELVVEILEVDCAEEHCARGLKSSFSSKSCVARLITCRWCAARLSATLRKPSISYN